ncbi:MAG: RHS repeat-associated core domain-containing protein [Planctomycetes bacterium]|nr:RHS repeat-associated core domain-containing protein [Planctomycetota bacterium]
MIEASDTSSANNDRAFQYDGIGNREKTVDGLLPALPALPNYAATSQNQYASIGALSPSYDADGNATGYPLPAAPGQLSTLVWNGENRLISATVAGTTSTYSYDYRGRRISKQVGAAPATRYIYEGWNVIAEYVSGTLDRSYTWGMDLSGSMQGAGGVGGLLAVHIGTENYFPTYDGNGNVGEYLDASGAVAAHFEYDAFGNETVSSSSAGAPTFAHRFSTKPLDAESGLYYYGFRYCEPITGRWINRDPIFERGGINLVALVRNRVVNSWDGLGLAEMSWSEKFALLKLVGLRRAGTVKRAGIMASSGATVLEPRKDKSKTKNWGNEWDAVRHCLFQCYLSRAVGAGMAAGVGEIHEDHAGLLPAKDVPKGYDSPEEFAKYDRAMDEWNNFVGRVLSGQKGNCFLLCREARGCLWVNRPARNGEPGGYQN